VQDYRENEPKQFLEAPENAQIKDYLKRVLCIKVVFNLLLSAIKPRPDKGN
jgi:hypothetical protein